MVSFLRSDLRCGEWRQDYASLIYRWRTSALYVITEPRGKWLTSEALDRGCAAGSREVDTGGPTGWR